MVRCIRGSLTHPLFEHYMYFQAALSKTCCFGCLWCTACVHMYAAVAVLCECVFFFGGPPHFFSIILSNSMGILYCSPSYSLWVGFPALRRCYATYYYCDSNAAPCTMYTMHMHTTNRRQHIDMNAWMCSMRQWEDWFLWPFSRWFPQILNNNEKRKKKKRSMKCGPYSIIRRCNRTNAATALDRNEDNNHDNDATMIAQCRARQTAVTDTQLLRITFTLPRIHASWWAACVRCFDCCCVCVWERVRVRPLLSMHDRVHGAVSSGGNVKDAWHSAAWWLFVYAMHNSMQHVYFNGKYSRPSVWWPLFDA